MEYIEVVDPFTLTPIEPGEKTSLLAIAARSGNTRLIDHTFLMTRKPIVAIDGPAGAGKSTITRLFAKELGLLYLDTGAMYRAITWLIIQEKIDPKDESAVSEILKGFDLTLKVTKTDNQAVHVNGIEVTDAIRSPEVTSLVSLVSAQSLISQATDDIGKMP